MKGFGISALLIAALLTGVVFASAVNGDGPNDRDQWNTDKTVNDIEFTKDGLNNGNPKTINITLYPNGVTKSDKMHIPKGIEIPESWKTIEVERYKPTEEDWVFVKSAMTNLSEGERNRLISEAKNIYESNSTLAEEEQKEILQKLGHYTLKATEGYGVVAPMWSKTSGHWHMSRSAGENLDYITSEHIDTLGDYSWWADDNREEPSDVLKPWGINRHSWIIDGLGVQCQSIIIEHHLQL